MQEIVEPNNDLPDEGSVNLSVKLPALCSAKYCTNDPINDELVLTQMMKNIINSSKMIDYKKLCILEEKVLSIRLFNIVFCAIYP